MMVLTILMKEFKVQKFKTYEMTATYKLKETFSFTSSYLISNSISL